MKKHHLEIALSRLDDLEDPDPSLEQYRTPVDIVSRILWAALENGDILDRSVLELGCGGAPFALGALMLGANSATGIDVDPRCLDLAGSNLERCQMGGYLDLDARLDLINGDVSNMDTVYPISDTVFMNPPFGAQNKHADRGFVKTACINGSVIYGIHNGGTEKFVRSEYEKLGATEMTVEMGTLLIPHRFHFHRQEKRTIEIIIVRAIKAR